MRVRAFPAAVLAIVLALSPVPGRGPLRADAVADAALASVRLHEAIGALEAASGGREEVAALTRTIRAFEEGLAALRAAMREVALRRSTLERHLQSQDARLGRLLGALARMEHTPEPLLLLHPDGPLATVRSAMLLAEAAPVIDAEVGRLRAELAELATLDETQRRAGETLGAGLEAVQTARTALSQALSDRVDPPRRLVDDPQALRDLVESANTLGDFAAGLALDPEAGSGQPSFAQAKGGLDLPVLGTLIRRPGEADAAGIRRPGLTLATAPRALVTAPWPATIRFRGPLLDYGNVIILEPGEGYLLIVAGLAVVYGEVGEIIDRGAPLGLMGGDAPAGPPAGDALLTGAPETQTLYVEMRLDGAPVNAMEWFAATAG